MKKLIEKHQQNGTGTGKFRLPNSDEIEARVNAQIRNYYTQQPSTVAETVRDVRERADNQKKNVALKRAVKKGKQNYRKRTGDVSGTAMDRKHPQIAFNRNDPEDIKVTYNMIPTRQEILEARDTRINPNIDAELFRKQQQENYRTKELEEKSGEVLSGLMEAIPFPSKIVGAIAQSVKDPDTSFLESMMFGNKGLGEIDETAGTGTNLLFDIIAPAAWSKGLKLLGNATKYTFPIIKNLFKNSARESNYSLLYGNGFFVDNVDLNRIRDNAQKRFFTPEEIRRIYLETKRDAYRYFASDEFKRRALNAGFTEEDFPKLLQEVNEHLKNTKFDPSAIIERNVSGRNTASIAPRSIDTNGNIPRYLDYTIKFNPNNTYLGLKTTSWHELMHSIGGLSRFETDYPFLRQLTEFNMGIQPTPRVRFNLQLDPKTNLTLHRIIKKYSSPTRATVDAARNNAYTDWLNREIVNKPWEFRSRMSTTNYMLRQLGYDTSKLIDNPELFNNWMTEIKNAGIEIPYDTNHVRYIYGDKLKNPASKILGTVGGLYLGSQLFNNNNE